VGEGTSPARPSVVAAREALLAARGSLDEELLRLEASGRAAVDIKAKVKRNPVKAAGLAAGAGFVVVGGPQRLFRRAKRAVMGPEEPLPKSMLPKDIEKQLKKLGTDGDRVRGTIEREFARYLDDKAEERKSRDLTGVIAALLLSAGKPFVTRYGKQVAERLVSPDGAGYREQLEKLRAARKDGSGTGGDTPA
jgi:hypothetical protein